MKCSKCGGELRQEWAFCPKCGNGTGGVIFPEQQLKLFVKRCEDGHEEYRYGPEWVAAQLWLEGGYATPEEAKAAWAREA